MKYGIITGASRGIGQATAEAFLAADWHITGSSTSGTANSQHPDLEMLPLDLANVDSIQAFAERATKDLGQIDLLINCAGVNFGPDDEPLSIDKLRATLETNLIGTIALTETLLDKIHDGGLIINISSTAGLLRPIPAHIIPYRISKAGVNIYTQVLAERLEARQITVVAYNPGWVRTDMGSENAPKLPSQVASELLAMAENPPESGTFWDETTFVEW